MGRKYDKTKEEWIIDTCGMFFWTEARLGEGKIVRTRLHTDDMIKFDRTLTNKSRFVLISVFRKNGTRLLWWRKNDKLFLGGSYSFEEMYSIARFIAAISHKVIKEAKMMPRRKGAYFIVSGMSNE
ncbi:MAG: hypothetical protein AAB575_03295 [Patescibacteria group bacterium]